MTNSDAEIVQHDKWTWGLRLDSLDNALLFQVASNCKFLSEPKLSLDYTSVTLTRVFMKYWLASFVWDLSLGGGACAREISLGVFRLETFVCGLEYISAESKEFRLIHFSYECLLEYFP